MSGDMSKLEEKLGDDNFGMWDAQFRCLTYQGIIATGVVPNTP
jgi:hypothetical protein